MHETDSPRDQAIIDLLRVYRDLEGGGPVGSGSGSRDSDRLLYGGGSRTQSGGWKWDADWDKSGCDALDDALKRLRAERPVQWWHTTERYVRCEVRSRKVKMERSHSGALRLPKPGAHTAYLGGGVRLTDSWTATEQLVVIETWRPQVRLEKVRRGVRSLAIVFPWDKFRWRELTQAAAA